MASSTVTVRVDAFFTTSIPGAGRPTQVPLPVWVAAMRYGGKIHRLVVNGQTGRCHGSAPVSTVKIVVAVLLAAIAAALVAWGMSR